MPIGHRRQEPAGVGVERVAISVAVDHPDENAE